MFSKSIRTAIILWLLLCLNACQKNNDDAFKRVYGLIQEDDFFKAKEYFESHKTEISKTYQKVVSAILGNAFNDLDTSNTVIDGLIKEFHSIPDSLRYTIFQLKYDNAVKQFNYSSAKQSILMMQKNYGKYMDEGDAQEYDNNLKIWSSLENAPPQKVHIKEKTIIKMKKDIAGLNTIQVLTGKDSLDFIFDTGANLSTTSESIAKQLKMAVYPTEIEVGTITGNKVLAKLAICDELSLGSISLNNVVFLVLPDEALNFPQINYQIFGILGFPVLEALKEITITQKGDFIVPKVRSTFNRPSNLAVKGLNPLVSLNNMHFTFDTGADHTILYHRFYMDNKQEIEDKYHIEKISFGGAGGVEDFEGFTIDYTFNVGGRQVELKNISLLKHKIDDNKSVYGNIGQDLIQSFDTMTLNFEKMFIKFE
jgi:predicted aspartyl protease